MENLKFVLLTWIFITCGFMSFILMDYVTPLAQIPLFVLGIIGAILLPFTWFSGTKGEQYVGFKIFTALIYAFAASLVLIIAGLAFSFQMPTSYSNDSAYGYDYYRRSGFGTSTCIYYDQTTWFTMKEVERVDC